MFSSYFLRLYSRQVINAHNIRRIYTSSLLPSFFSLKQNSVFRHCTENFVAELSDKYSRPIKFGQVHNSRILMNCES